MKFVFLTSIIGEGHRRSHDGALKSAAQALGLLGCEIKKGHAVMEGTLNSGLGGSHECSLDYE